MGLCLSLLVTFCHWSLSFSIGYSPLCHWSLSFLIGCTVTVSLAFVFPYWLNCATCFCTSVLVTVHCVNSLSWLVILFQLSLSFLIGYIVSLVFGFPSWLHCDCAIGLCLSVLLTLCRWSFVFPYCFHCVIGPCLSWLVKLQFAVPLVFVSLDWFRCAVGLCLSLLVALGQWSILPYWLPWTAVFVLPYWLHWDSGLCFALLVTLGQWSLFCLTGYIGTVVFVLPYWLHWDSGLCFALLVTLGQWSLFCLTGYIGTVVFVLPYWLHWDSGLCFSLLITLGQMSLSFLIGYIVSLVFVFPYYIVSLTFIFSYWLCCVIGLWFELRPSPLFHQGNCTGMLNSSSVCHLQFFLYSGRCSRQPSVDNRWMARSPTSITCTPTWPSCGLRLPSNATYSSLRICVSTCLIGRWKKDAGLQSPRTLSDSMTL